MCHFHVQTHLILYVMYRRERMQEHVWLDREVQCCGRCCSCTGLSPW
jgi:hypothetical protein